METRAVKAPEGGRKRLTADREVLDYIQDLAGGTKRGAARLSVRLPLGWTVPGRSGFSECLLTDVSRDGVGVEFPGTSEGVSKGAPVKFQVLIPDRLEVCEFEAEVRWVFRSDENRDGKKVCLAGLQYKNVPSEIRLAVLRYAWDMVQRRRLRKFGTFFLVFALVFSGLFAAGYGAIASRAKSRLVVSESERARLEGILAKLSAELDSQLKVRSENQKVLAGQAEMMKEQSGMVRRQADEIARKQKEIEDRNGEVLKQSVELSRQQEEMRTLEGTIQEKGKHLDALERMIDEIGQEWDIKAGTLRLVMLDPRYERAKKAFEEKRYEQAVSDLEDLQRRFPDANLLYKMLYRVHRQSGRADRAEAVFQEYAQKIKADLEASLAEASLP